MKSSDVKKAIKVCYKARRPFFLWGPPGVGKSDTIRQAVDELFAEEYGIKIDANQKAHDSTGKFMGNTRPYLRDVRASQMDPVDLRGLPAPDGNGGMHWLTPNFFPREGTGIFYADELNSAPLAVQTTFYQLMLDFTVGEYTMPVGWLPCAAGNRETDRAVTNRMPSALSNRLIHLHFDVDNNDWQQWALDNDVMTEVISFLRFRPALLHSFDPTKNEKTFPTPRSWQFVSDLLKHSPRNGIEFEIIKGTVGEGAAAEFVGFLRIFRNLPNPDSVLMNPATAPVPDMNATDGPATLWALCGALSRKASEQTMPNLVAYANRLPDEFSVLLIRDSEQLCPDIRNTRAYIEWASKHANVLI